MYSNVCKEAFGNHDMYPFYFRKWILDPHPGTKSTSTVHNFGWRNWTSPFVIEIFFTFAQEIMSVSFLFYSKHDTAHCFVRGKRELYLLYKDNQTMKALLLYCFFLCPDTATKTWNDNCLHYRTAINVFLYGSFPHLYALPTLKALKEIRFENSKQHQ